MKYEVIINSPSKTEYKYDYSYRDKNITLHFSKKGIKILAERKTTYSSNKIVSGKALVFNDAIIKSALVYSILYSKSLIIKSMTIMRGRKKDVYSTCNEHFAVLHSIIKGELNSSFSCNWNNSNTIESILNILASDNDLRLSSLYALIDAKSKKYEAERFVNFWISFNGMYGYFSKIVDSIQMKKTSQENSQLTYFIKAECNGTEKLSRNESNKIGSIVTKFLEKENTNVISKDWLNTPNGTEFSNRLLNIINANLPKGRVYGNDAYAYLLVDYAYYFRCNLIHANKPLPLFCFENDNQLKSLRLVNQLLEEYISQNLYLWFQSDYVEYTLTPLAQQIL